MSSALSTKSVFVTGAGRGIGKTIALHLAKVGYTVFGCARGEADLKDLRQESENRIQTSALDVTDSRAVLAWFQNSRKSAPQTQPWGLVTAAGIYGPIGPFIDQDLVAFSQAMDINLMGTLIAVQGFLKLQRDFAQAGSGARLVLLSGGGATKPMPFFSSYAASKAAVVRWGESLAGELIDQKITVNSLAPGAINTKLTQEVVAAGAGLAGAQMYQAAQKQLEGGGQDPLHAAQLSEFLLGPAGGHVTGKLISAIWDPWRELSDPKHAALSKEEYMTLRRISPPGV